MLQLDNVEKLGGGKLNMTEFSPTIPHIVKEIFRLAWLPAESDRFGMNFYFATKPSLCKKNKTTKNRSMTHKQRNIIYAKRLA